MLIKALLFVALAQGQSLPEQVKDSATSEVVEYLGQEIRKNRTRADLIDSDIKNGTNQFTGVNTFNNAVIFNASVTLNGGSFGNFNVVFGTSTPSGSGTNTVLGVCVPGSTIPLTMAGGGLACGYSGSISNTGGVGTVWAILTNGVLPSGFTATKGFVDHLNGLSSNGTNVSSQWQSTGTYSGSMSVCLTVATNSGTWVVPGATNTGFTDIAQFWCREVR